MQAALVLQSRAPCCMRAPTQQYPARTECRSPCGCRVKDDVRGFCLEQAGELSQLSAETLEARVRTRALPPALPLKRDTLLLQRALCTSTFNIVTLGESSHMPPHLALRRLQARLESVQHLVTRLGIRAQLDHADSDGAEPAAAV